MVGITGYNPESDDSFLLSAGEYHVELKKASNEKTKKGRKLVKLGFKVVTGESSGSWVNLSLWYDEKGVALIPYSSNKLKRLMRCVGVDPEKFTDTDQLLKKPLIAVVVIDENENDEPKNDIKGFKALVREEESKETPAGESGGETKF